jgi:hypothetical protein
MNQYMLGGMLRIAEISPITATRSMVRPSENSMAEGTLAYIQFSGPNADARLEM